MSLNAFLNPVKLENKKVVVSNRFVENGKPVEWEIKTITAEQDEALRKSCLQKTKNKNGTVTRDTNIELYLSKLAVACVVYPDLENIELQNAYNVMGAENLLKKMLTGGEYYELLNKIQDINGFDKSFEDLVDEAKN